MWSIVYGTLQVFFWIAGRIEDTRSRKIRKSDLEIREQLARDAAARGEKDQHEVHGQKGSEVSGAD